MKKLHLLIMTLFAVAVMAACHSRMRRTIIATSSDNNAQRIEYSGAISFNADKTEIERMSPRAYIEYDHNGEKLRAKSDSRGHILYQLSNGAEATQVNGGDRRLLAEAIQLITKQQHLQKNNSSY